MPGPSSMQASVLAHPELRILGHPTFLFSFTSDAFDIYHVNDFMRDRGWRFNGQQYPNALHMAVTRPQTQSGVADQFATDLAGAVAYAREHASEAPRSGAIYGGVAGGMTDEADEFIKMVMGDMLDTQQSIPSDA
jgi:sphinganine-1-phosphate aldolase